MKDKKEYTGDSTQNRFTAYAEVALKNNRVSYFRKQQALKNDLVYFAEEDELPTDIHTDAPVDDSDLPEFRHKGLIDAISQLSEKDLIILRLRVLYGYSYKKISVILGIPADTANKRYLRAVTKLRKRLEDGNDIP